MLIRLLIGARWVAGWVPLWLGLFVADRIGEVAGEVGGRARGAVESNMRQVLGEDAPLPVVQRTRRQVFRNVVRNYYALLRASRLTDAELLTRITFEPEGTAQLRQLVAGGQGILLATPHWGVFDLLIQAVPLLGLPMSIVAARFRPVAFVEFINDLRAQRGARVIWTGEGQAIKQALVALKTGEVVGIAPDRSLDSNGIPIPFFGAEAHIATGMAKMALRTGVPIVTGFAYPTARNHYTIVFSPPIYAPPTGTEAERIAALTRQVFVQFEAQIAQAPDQWVLLQPVWAATPPPPPAE